MKITEFFDDGHPKHVMAFTTYMFEEKFPEGFLPDDIEFDE